MTTVINLNYDKLINELNKLKYNEYLKTDHWIHFKKEALLFFGNKCFECGKQEDLHVHHLTYDNRGRETFNDIIILCKDCHIKKHYEKLIAIHDLEDASWSLFDDNKVTYIKKIELKKIYKSELLKSNSSEKNSIFIINIELKSGKTLEEHYCVPCIKINCELLRDSRFEYLNEIILKENHNKIINCKYCNNEIFSIEKRKKNFNAAICLNCKKFNHWISKKQLKDVICPEYTIIYK